MSTDLCDILILAYCAANGQITHSQITNAQVCASPVKGRISASTPNYLARPFLLKKYHFLKTVSADTFILTVQGLVYVEENDLVPPQVIRRDQTLRTGLLRVAEANLAGDEGCGPVWNNEMLADGYTQEEIDGRLQYLHALHLL